MSDSRSVFASKTNLAWLILVAACGRDARPDDCKIVRDEPTRALAELSKRYPNAPVKVAETIERCVAPSGDECDRIAKVVTAIPDLAPQLPKPSEFDYAKTCRDSPAELRRCLLPSYVLGHVDECEKAKQALLTKPITIEPRERDARPADNCGSVALYLGDKGIWLATGTDEKARCYAPHKAGALDHQWLEAQLGATKTADCAPAVELAAAATRSYQDVVEAMDTAVKVGLPNVGLSSIDELPVPLATADTKGAAKKCPAGAIAGKAAAADAPKPPPGDARDTLSSAPVIVITRDDIMLGAESIAKVADAKSGTGELAPLRKALPVPKTRLVILQADQSTPAGVIDRVVKTAKAAGYDNLMFAVKNR
jgi:biopolymer transport protein ExbD